MLSIKESDGNLNKVVSIINLELFSNCYEDY